MSITLSFVKEWRFHTNYLHLIYYEFILSKNQIVRIIY